MPLSRRTGDLTILIAAGALTLLLSAAAFLIEPVSGTPPVDGSSLATHAHGARGTYLGLKEAGYDVQQSFEPLAYLRMGPSAVLIISEPLLSPSQLDLRALVAFIERGGTVLATGPVASKFLAGVPTASEAKGPSEPGEVNAALPSALSVGVPKIRMATAASAVAATTPYLTIYGTDARPAVLAARMGQGLAIWWAGPTPLTNIGITEPGHLDLLLNILGSPGERQVIWDEHYHGRSRSLLSYAAGTPAPFAAAQLVAVFLAGLLTYSRRRWPIRAEYVEPRTSPLEFVESMGALYQKANTTAGVVSTVRARVRRTIAAASGLPARVDDEHLSRVAASRVGIDGDRLQRVLASSAGRTMDADLTPEDAKRTVQELQQLGAAAGAARRGRR